MVINHWISVNNLVYGQPVCTGSPATLLQTDAVTPEALYGALHSGYPKFYKMDKLCKWAFVAGECLFPKNGPQPEGDKNNTALVLTTNHGCIDVDTRYQQGIALPSPALFVYTLPNIMLGELCIRHGFKGEQLCMVSEHFDAYELYFSVSGLLTRGMDACLCGWVDAFDDQYEVCLFWITKKGSGLPFTPTNIQQLYTRNA